MVKNAPATPRLVSSRGVINTFRGASLLFIWWISSPGCHKSIPREKSIVFSFCPFPLTPLPPLTLPLRYRLCWVDVSLDLVSLLAVHYHCCALLTFCSAVQKYFFTKKCYEPRWTRHLKSKGNRDSQSCLRWKTKLCEQTFLHFMVTFPVLWFMVSDPRDQF